MSPISQTCNVMHGSQQVLQQYNRIERHSRQNPEKSHPAVYEHLKRGRDTHNSFVDLCATSLMRHRAANDPDMRVRGIVDQEASK